jgi:hypothetical protein
MKILELKNGRYLIEQCRNVEEYIPEKRRKYCTINYTIFAIGVTRSVALWSMN